MSEDSGSMGESDKPIFRPFTRESLVQIESRITEEYAKKKELEKKRAEGEVRYEEDDMDDSGPHPDSYLEQGMPLPIRMAAAFDPELACMPLEDFDPFYANQSTFVIVSKNKNIFRFSATDAVYLLSPWNPVRRVAIAILTHSLFTVCIICTILTNCLVMILPASPTTESTEVLFTAIYTFESAVKVMARGFILEKFTYLRDAWNWLDFCVITLAYVTMGINLGNLAALRTFRVLRALKTVAIIPGLKTIVGAVIESVKNLRDVIILTMFSLSVFALMGLQIYMGILTQICIKDFPFAEMEFSHEAWYSHNMNDTNWFKEDPDNINYRICGNSTGAGQCPENYACLQGFANNPDYGYTSFDSFGWALLSAFRLMTQDFWESLYQQVLRAAGPWHMLFFILVIFLGSFYLVNLILAIVAMSYDELQKKAEEDELAAEAEAQAMKEEAEEAAKLAEEAEHRPGRGRRHGGYERESMDKGSYYESYDRDNEQMKEDASMRSEFAEETFVGDSYDSRINKKLRRTSLSLPGSPMYSAGRRKSSRYTRRTGEKVLSSYIDAQEHLPFADDSSVPTPMSEENGIIVTSYNNGCTALTSNNSSAVSQASRMANSSNNVDLIGTSSMRTMLGGSASQPAVIVDESQLKQKSARSLRSLMNQDGSGDNLSSRSKEKYQSDERESFRRDQYRSHESTVVEMNDVMVLNEIMAEAGRESKMSERAASIHYFNPDEEGGNRLKQILIDGCFRLIDIFCVWDCGFPWNILQKYTSWIVFDPFAELLITLAIAVNTFFMALDGSGTKENVQLARTLKIGNVVFSTIFAVECGMKLIAMSPKYYFQVGWNIFDFIIVTLSLLEMLFEDAGLPGISALRSFRLLRVFKLAKSWPTLNLLISIMGKTMGALGNLVFVLLIIIFIFAVMGMQLFAKNYYDKVSLFPGGELPRWNFTDFWHSFMIIFRVLCGEWIESMWDCMLVTGGGCVPFFLSTVVIGNLVVLNLFLALLLSSFGASNLSSPQADAETNKLAEAFHRIGRFNRWIRNGIQKAISSVFNLIRCSKKTQNQISDEVPDATSLSSGTRSQNKKLIKYDKNIAQDSETMILNDRKPNKKGKLNQKARMVMNVQKLTNPKKGHNNGNVKNGKKKLTRSRSRIEDEEETFSMKSYASQADYLNKVDNNVDDSEDESTLKNDVSKDDMVESIDGDDIIGKGDEDDHDEDEEDEDHMGTERSKHDEEEENPADCFPPPFYERFPIFNVDGTPFGVGWANIRLKTFRLIENKYFETAVIIMILLSSLALALEDVHLPQNPVLIDILYYMDRIFTVIFLLEMLVKWLALGFRTYFTNAWCWLDFVIVMVSIINFIAGLAGLGSVQAFKTMRTLRALRPLRAMSRMQGMRVVVNALVQAIPSIFNVLLVCLIFWLIFAIMGVQLFTGKFQKCIDPSDNSKPDYRIIQNKDECLANNMTWENSQMNFDHVGKAYLSLFQIATFKGWIDIMNDAVDSRLEDEQPHRESNFVMYVYFVIFIIFGSFFTLNLFIGVIIDNFNEQKKKAGGSLEMFMTEDQKKYYNAMKKMGSKKPLKAVPRPSWRPQTIVFEIITNQKFDMLIMLFIGLNMLIMTFDGAKNSEEWDKALEILNAIFIAIFSSECGLKIFALRYHYFIEPWNLFDFVVVILSILGLLLSDLIAQYFVSPTLLRVVRVAKVGRVLRLVKGAKGIRTLLFALAMSLPALFNICLLLFLVMFIFAIFGMSFFMNVKTKPGGLDDVYNFRTFGQSMILLFQMSTSAGWDTVLKGITDEEDCTEPNSELGYAGDCGSSPVGIAFLLSYLVISFLIIINMYIAVILENYSQATEEVQEGLTDDDYDMYYEIWAQFDPDGTQYIKYEQLSDFLNVLEQPLQIHKPNKFKIIAMDIAICKGDLMYCVDILDALTRDFFARKGNAIETETVEMSEVQLRQDRPGYEPVSSTLWRQREEHCARMIQNIWRRFSQDRIKNRQMESSEVDNENFVDPLLPSFPPPKTEFPIASIVVNEVESQNPVGDSIPKITMTRSSSSKSSHFSDV